MNVEEIIPTILMLNIYMALCLPKALTPTRLQWYQLFRNNTVVGFQGILSFPLLRDVFLHRLATQIPLKEALP
jgi:hypothetical protein